MEHWTEERIAWYQRAIDYTGYDRELADEITPFLDPEGTVCDLGCGTGYLAMELAWRGYRVSAMDKSENAVKYVRREAEKRRLEHLSVRRCDWFDAGGRWDTVIMCLSGCKPEDLPFFMSLSRKRLIIIMREGYPKCDTGELERILGENRLRYSAKSVSMEFGQPFVSEQDFHAYLDYFKWSPKLAESARKGPIRLYGGDYPMYLSLQRRMRIYVIDAGGQTSGTEARGDAYDHCGKQRSAAL